MWHSFFECALGIRSRPWARGTATAFAAGDAAPKGAVEASADAAADTTAGEAALLRRLEAEPALRRGSSL